MKVALLDDDQSHNALVASVLDPAGFTCTSFTTPSRLLAELRKQTFDLIILDWNMPELSGVETLKLLREDPLTAPPVLLLTSRSVEADLVEGLNAGADDYIVKPLQPQVLLARVNAVVRRIHRPPSQPQPEQYGQYRLNRPQTQVIGNVQAQSLSTVEDIRKELEQQLTQSVRWTESMQAIIAEGAEHFIEIGAGGVLSGLMRRIDRNKTRITLNAIEAWDSFLRSQE